MHHFVGAAKPIEFGKGPSLTLLPQLYLPIPRQPHVPLQAYRPSSTRGAIHSHHYRGEEIAYVFNRGSDERG